MAAVIVDVNVDSVDPSDTRVRGSNVVVLVITWTHGKVVGKELVELRLFEKH